MNKAKLVRAIYVFLMIGFFAPTKIVHAETYIIDVAIDLEADGRVIAFYDQDSWEGVVGLDDTILTAGDTVILRIRFLNQKSLQLSNPGINELNSGLELTKLTFLSSMPIGNDWSTSGIYRYIGVDGDILSNPTEWSVNGGGQAYVGPFSAFNLTDTTFTYNGIDIVININSYSCLPEFTPCVFDQMEWSSSSEDVQIVDAITLAASIDITPKGKTAANVINLRKDKNIIVAILTDSAFDAIQVDPATVSFGPEGAIVQRYRVTDVDHDGDMDLTLSFKTMETGISCNDISASLTGVTYGGRTIEGSDYFSVKQPCQ